jgi:glyoxylate/hydroxypyruvate reductase A
MITPHVSSLTPPYEVARQIVENYKRALSGMELLDKVDKAKGY